MNEWFSPEMGRWLSLLSLLSLLACTAPWISKGKHNALAT